MIFHENRNQKRAEVLISLKIHFNSKAVKRDKDGY